MRKGFTLIELLVCIAIVAILAFMVVGGIKGCSSSGPTGQSYYNTTQSNTFVCVKTYTVSDGEDSSSKRVDLRPKEGGTVVTMECDDSFRAGISNSATLYAQFEPGKEYEVGYIGFRKEGWMGYFPIVKSVKEVEK